LQKKTRPSTGRKRLGNKTYTWEWGTTETEKKKDDKVRPSKGGKRRGSDFERGERGSQKRRGPKGGDRGLWSRTGHPEKEQKCDQKSLLGWEKSFTKKLIKFEPSVEKGWVYYGKVTKNSKKKKTKKACGVQKEIRSGKIHSAPALNWGQNGTYQEDGGRRGQAKKKEKTVEKMWKKQEYQAKW